MLARMLVRFLLIAFVASACSTTYKFRGEDLERVRQGTPVANVADPSGEDIDFTHYAFVYRSKDAAAPLKIKGIESLNRSSQAGMLNGALSLDAAPGVHDKVWQRTTLGAGVGFLSGLGVGYAITNRVLVERSARDPDCSTCNAGFLVLGSVISALIGGGIGATLAYFGGSGVGQVRIPTVQFLGEEPSSQPTSQPIDLITP